MTISIYDIISIYTSWYLEGIGMCHGIIYCILAQQDTETNCFEFFLAGVMDRRTSQSTNFYTVMSTK